MKNRIARAFMLVIIATLLVSCVGSNSQIGTTVTLCCPGNYEEYATYALETRDMPLFLQDYVLAEFEAAVQERGLYKAGGDSDLNIVLSYKHISLDPEQQDIDPFVRVERLTVELHYLAVLEISMFDSRTSKKVWGGELSRFHHVTPGEYMHEEGARPSFRQAFVDVLALYPSPVSAP